MAGILRTPGSKRQHLAVLRSFLDPLITPDKTFVDLFVGGGSVLLDVAERYPDISLVANDMDKGIAALWGVVAGPEKDVLALEAMLDIKPTRALWDRLRAEHCEDPVRAAFATVYLSRTSFRGILNARCMKDIGSRFNPDGIRRQIRRARELLHGRLTVTSIDAKDWLDQHQADEHNVVFVDPPYVVEGNDLYRVGMSPREHAALRDRLRERDVWVLTYRDHRTVRHLYGSWCDIHCSPEGKDEVVIVPAGAPGEIPAEEKSDSHDLVDDTCVSDTSGVKEAPDMARHDDIPLGPNAGEQYPGNAERCVRQLAYRPKQAGAQVGLHKNTIEAEIREGRLKAKKKGKATVILHEDLMAWLHALPEYER